MAATPSIEQLPRAPLYGGAIPEFSESSDGSLVVQHEVTDADTLSGLALRYNVSVVDIRRANGLLANDPSRPLSSYFLKKYIQIPCDGLPSSADPAVLSALEERRRVRRFMDRCLCDTREEARAYLQLHENDLQKAVQAWFADLAWESGQKAPGSASAEPQAAPSAVHVPPVREAAKAPGTTELSSFDTPQMYLIPSTTSADIESTNGELRHRTVAADRLARSDLGI